MKIRQKKFKIKIYNNNKKLLLNKMLNNKQKQLVIQFCNKMY